MKKLLTLISLSIILCNTYSQIVMLSSDMPTPGWTQRVAKDTLPLPTVNFGNKGANQVYDFSNFVAVFNDTIEYRTPTQSQLDSIPGSSLAITTDGVNFLLTNTTPTKFILTGFEGNIFGSTLQARYNPAGDLFQFPTQYNNNFSGTAVLTKTVAGSSVGQPGVHRVRLTVTTQYRDTIDGWGKVITPLGAYKGLRKKRVETTTTLIEAQLIQGFPYSQVSNTTNTTTRYTYPTREAKGSVVNFDYDSLNNVTGVTWSLIPPTIPFANFSHATGGGGLVLFTDLTDGYPDTYSWNFGDGSPTSNQQNPNHIYTANGSYYVCLTVSNAGGSNMYCDSVHVTGITAANNPPLAVDDNASVLQPNSLIVNVGLNDIDPDGDNFCLTSVYGSSAFAIASTGNCTSVEYTPDSLFVGNDTCWYVICDNGSPSLCDTGMLVVTSTANPTLQPVANFTWSQGGNCAPGTFTSTSSNYTGAVQWTFYSINKNETLNLTGTNVQYADSSQVSNDVIVSISVSNQFGTATYTDTVNLACAVLPGVGNVFLENIKIYPNPAASHVTIDLSDNTTDIARNYVAIEVYSAIGESVKLVARDGQSSLVNLNVSDIATGTYVILIADNNGVRKSLGQFTKQ